MSSTETMSGARTTAELHPSVDPEVKAKMKRINALVSMLTPITSTRFALRGSSTCSGEGIKKRHAVAMGIARMVLSQNIHDHDAYCTRSAPMIRPETFAKAATLPKTPIARACSAGCGKRWTIKVSADGIVIAPATIGDTVSQLIALMHECTDRFQ